ncbi:NAD(P)H-quinone oxidoreductase subunit L, chloroplastic [Oryza brachyantha]|uniref:NAD(P)H-quinone oxidoreductase subunit L, chloroplastic n=1 Tax=Oryza brachyantha TaxID=4533 RepID=UPI00077610A2|nr:NAD(P)H-quinone oxidoreductase subunit L, chloroplastic [Oryza brachyantha]
MDATASTCRLLLLPSAACSTPPPRRQQSFFLIPSSTPPLVRRRHSANRARLLCLLHDAPAPAAAADDESSPLWKLAAALQCGAIWAAVEAPAALATVTGEEDLDILGILPTVAAIAFVYLFVFPPIIMNWMRLRWFKRKFVETYLQFMFTYLFFPGMMLWAPFVNFRKFPRDPTMKYPWSKPKEGTPLFKDRYPPIETYK